MNFYFTTTSYTRKTIQHCTEQSSALYVPLIVLDTNQVIPTSSWKWQRKSAKWLS